MTSISMAFLLTSLAGLSTILGIIPIFIKIKNKDKIIASSLAFASGVMFCVSVTDLIPESISMLRNYFNQIEVIFLSFLFIVIGIITSSLIDKYLPSTNYESLYKDFDMNYLKELAKLLNLNINAKISSFSKGMKRQCALICALATNAKYMFFDETFDGLDPVIRSTMKKALIKQMNKKKRKVVKNKI